MFEAPFGCEITALPEQRNAPRPHHQIAASPAQEEKTAQHQCTVPGQYHYCPLMESHGITTTSVTQQQNHANEQFFFY